MDSLDEGGGILMLHKINRNMLLLEGVFLCVLNECFLPVARQLICRFSAVFCKLSFFILPVIFLMPPVMSKKMMLYRDLSKAI